MIITCAKGHSTTIRMLVGSTEYRALLDADWHHPDSAGAQYACPCGAETVGIELPDQRPVYMPMGEGA
jgi:hypothetical protein